MKTMKRIAILTYILTLTFGLAYGQTIDLPVVSLLGSGNTDIMHPENLAFDSNPDTYWASTSNQPNNCWLEINFGQDCVIEGMDVFGGWSGTLSVEYFKDNGFHAFTGGTHLIRNDSSYGWNLLDLSYDKVDTDRIRLMFTNTVNLVDLGKLRELRILGKKLNDLLTLIEPESVYVLKQKKRHRKNHYDKITVKYLFDHNTQTDWQADYSDTKDFNEAEVELGGVQTIRRIKLFNAEEAYQHGKGRHEHWYKEGIVKIQYLNDNNWIDIGGLYNIRLENLAEGWNTFDLQGILIQTSKLRIIMEGREKEGLNEIEIWGQEENSKKDRFIYLNALPFSLDGSDKAIYSFKIDKKPDDVVLLHIAAQNLAGTDLSVSVNGKQPEKIIPHSSVNGMTVYQKRLTWHTLSDGWNFVEFSGNGTVIYSCKIESIPEYEYMDSDHPLLNRWSLSTVQGQPEIVDFGGTFHIEELYISYVGNKPNAAFYIEDAGGWTRWANEPEILPGAVGGEFLFRNAGTMSKIRIETYDPENRFTEIGFNGSPVNDGPPQVKILYPADEAYIDMLKSACFKLKGTVDNPDADLRINGKKVKLNGTDFEVPLVSLKLKLGRENTITATATNDSGQMGTDQITIYFGWPIQFTVNPSEPITYTAADKITVSGVVKNHNVIISVNDITVPVSHKSYSTVVRLNEGVNVITVKGTLKKRTEVSRTEQRIVIRTSQSPQIVILYPENGSTVSANSIKISGMVQSIVPVKVFANNILAEFNNGVFTSHSISLSEGENRIIVTATDLNGLTATKELTIFRDTTGPDLTVDQPAENSFIRENPVTVSGTVTDLNRVSVTVSGIPALINGNSFSLSIVLPEGPVEIIVQARDSGGNTTTISRNVLVDTKPPLPFTPVADPAGWTNNNKPTITFSAEDEGSGIEYYDFYMDDTLLLHNAESPYTFDDAVSDGTHTVKVTAFDKTGNSTEGEVKIFIDTVPPATPQDVEAISGIDFITLKWKDNPDEAIAYEIEREPQFTDEDPKLLSRTLENNTLGVFYDSDIDPGVTYTYTVTSVDRAWNRSLPSDEATIISGTATQEFGPDGGSLFFDAFELIFPANFLDDAYTVTIGGITQLLPDNPYALKAGPAFEINLFDGQGNKIDRDFKDFVILKFNYNRFEIPAGYSASDLGIYWFNEAGGYWEKIDYPVNDYYQKILSVKLLHFSMMQVMTSKYVSPSLNSYYDMGISPFKSYFQDNVESVSDGSLNINATDLRFPGRGGFDLVIRRTYDALSAEQQKIMEKNAIDRKTPIDTFGYGWFLNIPWIEESDKGKFIRLPEGQTIKIDLKGDTFEYHEGVHFKLRLIGSLYRLWLKDGTLFEFDASGKPIRQVDPSGKNDIHYQYSGKELTQITDSIERVITFTYKTAGSKRVIDRIEGAGRTVRFNYSSDPVITEVFDPLNRKTTYRYRTYTLRSGDQANWGNNVSIDYKNLETLETVHDYQYNNEAYDKSVSYTLDLLNEIVYPTGGTSSYSYIIKDQTKLEEWHESPSYTTQVPGYPDWIAYVAEYYYGAAKFHGQKFLVSSHTRDRKTTTYSYVLNSAEGNLRNNTFFPANYYMKKITTVSGEKTIEQNFKQLVYSGSYNLVEDTKDTAAFKSSMTDSSSIRIPQGLYEKISYVYNLPLRLVTQEDHFRGNDTNYAWSIVSRFDSWGNPVFMSDGSTRSEQTLSYKYHQTIKNLVDTAVNKNYNPITDSYSILTTTTSYNEVLGKPQTVTVTDGQKTMTTALSYYSNGNLKSRTDPNGLVTTMTYDSLSAFPTEKVQSGIVDADNVPVANIITKYHYNPATGLLEWDEDPAGYRTIYEYDLLGRMTKTIYLDNDTNDSNNPYKEYVYNDTDNTCEFYNEKRQKTLFSLDPYGRITTIDRYVAGLPYSEVKTSYVYDSLGRIEKTTDPRGYDTNYSYDGLDRVTRVTHPAVDGVRAFATLEYDDVKNEITVTDENGGRTKEKKDWAERLTEATQYCSYEDSVETYFWRFIYDSTGTKIRETNGNGGITNHILDAFGHEIQTELPSAMLIPKGQSEPILTKPTINNEFDVMGNKIKVENANGGIIRFVYDKLGHLVKETKYITDVFTNQQIEVVTKHYYDARGIKVMTIDPNGDEWLYTYSARGYLLSETDPEGNTKRYTYDLLGNKISETDPRGNGTNDLFTTWTEYDDLNRISKVILPDNTPTSKTDNPYLEYTYDVASNKLTERDANGLVASYTYNERNWITTKSINGEIKERNFYDKKGNLVEVKDALNQSVRSFYDSLDRNRKILHPMGNYKRFTYDAMGNKKTMEDGRHNTTRYDYNGLNLLVAMTDALNHVTQYNYDPAGNQVQMITANNLTYITKYDEMNRVIETIDSLGFTYRTSYDFNGNVIKTTDPRGTTWTYEYETNNLLKRTNGSNPNAPSYEANYLYDPAGNQISITDSTASLQYNMISGSYVPDPLNRTKAIERRFGGQIYRTEYEYNKPTLITRIKYPETMNWLEYKYDNQNRLNEIVGFTQLSGITYNANSAITGIAYVNNTSNSYEYDFNGRLKRLSSTNNDGNIQDLSFTYDDANNITWINNKEFRYDNVNQLTYSSNPGTFLEDKKTPSTSGLRTGDYSGYSVLNFNADPAAIIKLDYNSTSIGLDFGYGGATRIRKIILTPDESHQNHRITGNVIELYSSTDNSTYHLIGKDTYSFEKSKTGTIILTFINVLSCRYLKLNVLFDDRDASFTPEDQASFMNQLTKTMSVYQEATSWTEEFEYDNGSNRTMLRTRMVQTTEKQSLYYTNSNRLKTDGEYAFTYDEAGNMITKGNAFTIDGENVTYTATTGDGVLYWEYEYDILNRLIKVKKNTTIMAEYEYDPTGFRIIKHSQNGTVHYVPEGTEAIFEKNITKDTTKYYINALGRHIARIDGKIEDATAKVYYYHTDHLGSVKAVTNATGTIVWDVDYFAFGSKLTQVGNFGFMEELGFTGKMWDAEIELAYYNARWYSPDIGRFISEDAAQDGNNWYVYALNNPLAFFDPTGMFSGGVVEYWKETPDDYRLDSFDKLYIPVAIYVNQILDANFPSDFYVPKYIADYIMSEAGYGAIDSPEKFDKNKTNLAIVKYMKIYLHQLQNDGKISSDIKMLYQLSNETYYVFQSFYNVRGTYWESWGGIDSENFRQELAKLTAYIGMVWGTEVFSRFYEQFPANKLLYGDPDYIASNQVGGEPVNSLKNPTNYVSRSGNWPVINRTNIPTGGTPIYGADRIINSKGLQYPVVYVKGYGLVPFPEGPYLPNNTNLRNQFSPEFKADFKKWWIEQGRQWPEGNVNIHHIRPLSKGGLNVFENLIPLIQPEEHLPFTTWWRSYP